MSLGIVGSPFAPASLGFARLPQQRLIERLPSAVCGNRRRRSRTSLLLKKQNRFFVRVRWLVE